MADLATSESSPETDRDFDPNADMLVHDYDDERTMDEEEALSNESVGNELDDLQKESEMPIEELMALYRHGAEQQSGGASEPPPLDDDLSLDAPSSELHDTRSSSEEEILSNQDLTLDKDEIARDLLKNVDNPEQETSVTDLLQSVHVPSQTARLLRSNGQPGSSDDDSEDEDYQPEAEDDWKKTISVGSDYQASIPHGLCKYGDAPAYENEDRLLWDPHKLEDSEGELSNTQLERYLREITIQSQQAALGVNAIPQGAHVRDDEQALYLLLQCGHNVEEALRRRKMQAVPPTDPMSLWSEEECRNFENGLRTYGKDFYMVQQFKVKTRSVGELVQFYYLWKKTERHDVFASKTRLEKRKYALHPGVTDYMERFVDEQENSAVPRDRSASPINSLLFGDPKRHHHDLRSPSEHVTPSTPDMDIVTAMQLVHKVVETNKLQLSPLKHTHPPPPELTTTVSSITTCPIYVPPVQQSDHKPSCFVFGGAIPSGASCATEALHCEPVASLLSLAGAASATAATNVCTTTDSLAGADSTTCSEPSCKRLKVDASEEKENCVQTATVKNDSSSSSNVSTSSNDFTDRSIQVSESSSIATLSPSTKKASISVEKCSSPLLCEGAHKVTAGNLALAISGMSPVVHSLGEGGMSMLTAADSSRSPPLAASQSLAQ